jgi:hypothetical protein
MMEHRLQILLDDERYRKIADEASRRGISIAALIRDAIDQLPAGHAQRRAAIAAILAAEPMPVPQEPSDLRHEINAAHERIDA